MRSKTIKAGFAPFIHSGSDIKKWYLNVIMSIIPAAAVVVVLNPTGLLTMVFSIAGFLSGSSALSYWTGRESKHPEVYLKYILWGLFYTVVAAGSVPLPAVYIVSAISSAVMERISAPGRNAFPSFMLSLLLLFSFFSIRLAPPENMAMVISLTAGMLFLLVKRVLPIRFLFGLVAGTMFSWIFMPSLRIVLPAFVAIIFTPAGLIPEGAVCRFSFGTVAGILAGFLGMPGVFIAFLLRGII